MVPKGITSNRCILGIFWKHPNLNCLDLVSIALRSSRLTI